MPAPAWDDLAAFVDPIDFGTVAVIRFAAGGTRRVHGIFDDPYLGAKLGEHTRDTRNPTLQMAEADAAGIKRYDTVLIAGAVYDVLTGPQGDGTGMVTLDLAKQ